MSDLSRGEAGGELSIGKSLDLWASGDCTFTIAQELKVGEITFPPGAMLTMKHIGVEHDRVNSEKVSITSSRGLRVEVKLKDLPISIQIKRVE